MATLENDPDYLKFVEAYESEEKAPHITIDQHLEEIEAREKERGNLNLCFWRFFAKYWLVTSFWLVFSTHKC